MCVCVVHEYKIRTHTDYLRVIQPCGKKALSIPITFTTYRRLYLPRCISKRKLRVFHTAMRLAIVNTHTHTHCIPNTLYAGWCILAWIMARTRRPLLLEYCAFCSHMLGFTRFPCRFSHLFLSFHGELLRSVARYSVVYIVFCVLVCCCVARTGVCGLLCQFFFFLGICLFRLRVTVCRRSRGALYLLF